MTIALDTTIDYELSEQLCKEMLALEPVGYMPPRVNGEWVYKHPAPIRCHRCRARFTDGHRDGCTVLGLLMTTS